MPRTNDQVADELNLPIEDVEALADELGVPDDQWTNADVDDAADLLDDEDDEGEDDEDDDGDEVNEDDESDDDTE